jgi:hypothetical protein
MVLQYFSKRLLLKALFIVLSFLVVCMSITLWMQKNLIVEKKLNEFVEKGEGL